MPKNVGTLPDGRVVGYNSKAWKDYRKSDGYVPAHRGRPRKIKTDVDGAEATVIITPPPIINVTPKVAPPPTIEADEKTVEAPPPPIGSPLINPPLPKRKSLKTEKEADEFETYKQLVGAIFSAVAVLAGSDVYRFSEPESDAVAKPLARILRRNKGLKEAVEHVADPICLFAAVAFPLAVKAAAHKLEKQAAKLHQVVASPVVDVRTMQQSQPPPPPSNNGQVPFKNIIERISEGS